MNTNQNFDEYEINPLEDESKLLKKEKNQMEKEYKPLKLKTALFVVGGLHIVAIAGIMGFSAIKSHAEEIKKEDSDFLKNAPIVGVDNPKVAETSKPTPTPASSPKPNATPKPKVVTKVPEKTNPNYPQNTKEYVVKHGDTFYGIVKKYKLNAEKLKKINGIKDESKIAVGQKLKFM